LSSAGILQSVSDPEIPVLSVIDLGMIRGVELNATMKFLCV
jgi:ring-1,2-phenylacetyl-CoA epoxidase subunit PaaD